MTAFYNEIDPKAAAWLREMIADGLIPPGEVDERDIRDIRPDELRPFRQCHFFAGIGGWPLALRLAGWPDDRRVWTGSCPCPPFSSAGPNFRCPVCDTSSPVPNAVRTGAFDCIRCGHEWQADERHLWPELFRLARECRPDIFLGEQVSSADGRTWLDIVRASLEMLGYAVGAQDTCSAGYGAPNIRQREYFVGLAITQGVGSGTGLRDIEPAGDGLSVVGDDSAIRGLANADGGDASAERVQRGRQYRQRAQDGGAGGLAHASCQGPPELGGRRIEPARLAAPGDALRPGPANGFWRDADWIGCTDGKWRPVEPGTFPLAPSVPGRVALLRGAGNAINVEVARGFIEAVMSL